MDGWRNDRRAEADSVGFAGHSPVQVQILHYPPLDDYAVAGVFINPTGKAPAGHTTREPWWVEVSQGMKAALPSLPLGVV